MAEHDVVLFGATGFTGGRVAEHLAHATSQRTRWAIGITFEQVSGR